MDGTVELKTIKNPRSGTKFSIKVVSRDFASAGTAFHQLDEAMQVLLLSKAAFNGGTGKPINMDRIEINVPKTSLVKYPISPVSSTYKKLRDGLISVDLKPLYDSIAKSVNNNGVWKI